MDTTVKKEVGKAIGQYMVAAAIGLVISMLILQLIHPVIVSGNSMNPTFNDMDILITTDRIDINSLSYGDIIVFNHEGRQLIKRIVGMPGDQLVVINGLLMVNGKESEYQYEKINRPGCLSHFITLSDDEWFLMGDNRNNSLDCREIGAITSAVMEYKVIRKLFSKEILGK